MREVNIDEIDEEELIDVLEEDAKNDPFNRLKYKVRTKEVLEEKLCGNIPAGSYGFASEPYYTVTWMTSVEIFHNRGLFYYRNCWVLGHEKLERIEGWKQNIAWWFYYTLSGIGKFYAGLRLKWLWYTKYRKWCKKEE